MKTKSFLLINFLSLFLFFSARSQNNSIPNGGFEDWKVDTLYEDLKFFSSSNAGSEAFNYDPNVIKVSGLSGFAAQLKTITFQGDTIFGFIANALISDNGAGIITFIGGQPYTAKPDSFALNAKYNIKVGDSALIIVAFKKNGQTIAQNEFTITGNQSDWALKKFKLKSMVLNPDTMVIAIASSNPFANGSAEGSEITVDNLRFMGGGTQTIINGEMEDWALRITEEPDEWTTANIYENFGGIKTSIKTTDKLKGNYALRLESYAMDFGIGFLFQTGFIATGDFFNNNPGFPISSSPQKLTLDLKYLPVISKDTASFYVSFTKFNELTQSSEPVGGVYLEIKNTINTYTHYEEPISLSDIPDSASIFIFAGSTSSPKSGSVLFIDNLGFDNKALGIDISQKIEDGKLEYKLNGKFALNSNLSTHSNTTISMMDMSGKVVYSNVFSDVPSGPNVILFSIPNLAKGLYVYTIQTEGKQIANKVLVY